MTWTSDEEARRAMAAWVEAHGRAVRGYLWAVTGSPHDADDLCQQVFMRIWMARRQYREEGSSRAFLFRVADRVARDWLRRRREKTLSEPQWTLVEPSDDGERPDDRLLRIEAGKRLSEAMNVLTEAQRRVLLLKYYGDMTFTEIAQVAEMPLGTVLSHARRGLQRLRGHMEREWETGGGQVDGQRVSEETTR